MSGSEIQYAYSEFFGRILPISAPLGSYVPIVSAISWTLFGCFADAGMLRIVLDCACPETYSEALRDLNSATSRFIFYGAAGYFPLRGRYVSGGEVSEKTFVDTKIPADALHEFGQIDLGMGALRRGRRFALTHPHEEYFKRPHGQQDEGFYDVRVEYDRLIEAFSLHGLPKRRGRPKDSGSFAIDDELLFRHVDLLIQDGKAKTATGAAKILKDQISGKGHEVSRIERFVKRYMRSKLISSTTPIESR